MKTAIIQHNGVSYKWEHKQKDNLLRWVEAAYGDSYKIITLNMRGQK